VKEKTLDSLFSRYIRARDGHCQRCGDTPIDCSHIAKRRHKATRWDPENAVGHCRVCHSYLETHPAEMEAWARGHLGDDRYEAIMARSREIVHHQDLDAIAEKLRGLTRAE